MPLPVNRVPNGVIESSDINQIASTINGIESNYVKNDDARLTNARTPTAHTHTASQVSDLTEATQDIVGAFIRAGVGTSVTYDDAANTFTINASSGGGTTDPEIVRDVIGGAMVAGAGVQITVDDAGDKITVSSTAVLPTRKVVAGTGLTGGGDLAADRTMSVSFGTTSTSVAKGDHNHDTRYVRTVNGTGPDGSGNVAVSGGGSSFPYPPITSVESSWWVQAESSGISRTAGVGTAGFWPFPIMRPVRITEFRLNITTAGQGQFHTALYSPQEAPMGATKVADIHQNLFSTTTGNRDVTGLSLDLVPGVYWFAILATGTTNPEFLGASVIGSVSHLFMPRWLSTRNGGVEGLRNITTLPSVVPASGFQTANVSGGYYPHWAFKTAPIP